MNKFEIPFLVKPWQHQIDAINRFVDNDYKLGNHGEMGSGKTKFAWECVRVVCYKLRRVPKTLIISPKSVLENWYREGEANCHRSLSRCVEVLDGPGKTRIKALQNPNKRIFITNHEAATMPEFWKAVTGYGFEFLILDEAHRCKDKDSKRFKAIVKVADGCSFKLNLTGTPILKDGLDLWAQFRILNKNIFSENFYVYRAKYFYDKNERMPKHCHFPDWRIKPGAEAALNEILSQHSVRVLKKDCMDLPPLVRQTIYCELTEALAKHYDELEEEFITFINGEACIAELAITKMLRLQQVCNGIIPTQSGIQRLDCEKMLRLCELLEELTKEHKVIVWSNFIPTYEDITDTFTHLGLRYAVIRGEQSLKDRQGAIDAFNNDPSVRVVLANQQAGGVGIGLQAADYMIYYSKNFSLEQDLQSEARAHRGGSEIHEKITRIDLVTKGTVEEDVTFALQNKFSNAELILALKNKFGRRAAA